MSEKIEENRTNYIKTKLLHEISAKCINHGELSNFLLENATGLDGFMSTIYKATLFINTPEGATRKSSVILKFMRGEESFRESSKSYIQFANEIYVYDQILPAYEQLLAETGIHEISVNDWVPIAYKAQHGVIEGLSTKANSIECVLALEDLKPKGYMVSPSFHLTHEELFLMCKPLGEFHAMNYALRLINPTKHIQLATGIKPLYFHRDDPEDEKTNIFRVLHNLGFARFFDFYDRKLKQTLQGSKLEKCLLVLREKYGTEPTRLLEHLRLSINDTDEDEIFGVILHGDFNRNNILFSYEEESSGDMKKALHAKMIDFQELRYGSPGLDLSFFMYMNTPAEERDNWWMDILKEYHNHMLNSLTLVLKTYDAKVKPLPTMHEFLHKYNFNNFYKHFTKFAFYGVIISMHFMPWLLCSKEECQELTEWFERDMHSPEFHKISMEIGGDDANYQILNVIKHACDMGYMDNI